jgi:hypothetical protein
MADPDAILVAHRQSRTMSFVEAIANMVIGYVLAIATQIAVFPWFGIETGLAEHLAIGMALVAVSLARSYLLRRPFEAIRVRATKPPLRMSGGSGRRRLPYSRDFGGVRTRDQPSRR